MYVFSFCFPLCEMNYNRGKKCNFSWNHFHENFRKIIFTKNSVKIFVKLIWRNFWTFYLSQVFFSPLFIAMCEDKLSRTTRGCCNSWFATTIAKHSWEKNGLPYSSFLFFSMSYKDIFWSLIDKKLFFEKTN